MYVSYFEKIDGNVAKIHREFEKESSRKLPRLEEREKKHHQTENTHAHTFLTQ